MSQSQQSERYRSPKPILPGEAVTVFCIHCQVYYILGHQDIDANHHPDTEKGEEPCKGDPIREALPVVQEEIAEPHEVAA